MLCILPETCCTGTNHRRPDGIQHSALERGLIISVLAFMVLATTVLYSVLCSLAGLVPERIPRLSKEVAGFLALHRSSSNSEAN